MSFRFKCSYCNQSLEAENDLSGIDLECPACGRKIVVSAISEKEEPPRCPRCKTAMPETAIICVECGYNLKTGSTVSAAPPSSEKDQKVPSYTTMERFRTGCIVVVVAAVSGILWYTYNLIDGFMDKAAFQHVENICSTHRHGPVTGAVCTDSPREAVEGYLAKRPAGRFRSAVEAIFYRACVDGSYVPQNAPETLSERLRQFREVFSGSPRIEECEKMLYDTLDKGFRPDVVIAYFENYRHGKYLDAVADKLDKFLQTTGNKNQMSTFQRLIESQPALLSHTVYATLLLRELAQAEASEMVDVGNYQFFQRALVHRVDTFFAKYAERFAEFPKDATGAFPVLLDLQNARKLNTMEAYLDYIRRHGLSSPGRWSVLYWLAEAASGNVYELKNPGKTVMMIGPGQVAEQPAWAVYVLCTAWNDGLKKKRLSLKLDYSEEKKVTETITRLPYGYQTWIVLKEPIKVHRIFGNFDFSLVDLSNGACMLRNGKSLSSNPDLIISEGAYSYNSNTKEVMFSPGALNRGKMNFYNNNDEMMLWRYKVLKEGAEKALATLPAPSAELRGLLTQLQKPTAPESSPQNNELGIAAGKVLNIR